MTANSRMLRLGGFFSVPGNHLAGWRHPDAIPTYDMDFQGYAHITQVAEAATLAAMPKAKRNDLTNLVTLCHADHLKETAKLQKRKARERRADR